MFSILISTAKGVTTMLRAMVYSRNESVAFVTRAELHAVVKEKLNKAQSARGGGSNGSNNVTGSARAKDFVSHVEAGRREMYGTLKGKYVLKTIGHNCT